jgi:hypothetical protein
VTGNSANVTYNGSDQSVSGFTATGLVNGQTESVLSGVTASGASGANFGTYTNTVSGTDSNYTLTLVNGTLAIAKAALTVTGTNATPSYTGLAQTNSAATITGIQGNTDSFTITGYGTGTNAGTYNDTLLATAAGATNAANYTISYTNGSLVIGKATLTVTADNKTKVYGDANPALTATITGYVNGESASVITGAPAISTTATQYSNVASYTITPVVGTLAASNYNFTYANGALSVTAAPLTITGASANPTYSGLAQTNSAATITGIKGSTDSFTITGYGTGTNAGTHLDTLVATAVGATQATNYDITITNGALTIDKANATVTGNSANPTYTGLAQSVAGFTATGLVNGQTESVLSGVTASGASATNAGTYTNTVSGTDSNYTLTLVNGALTIAKANATVTGNSANVTYNGSDQSVSGFTATGLVNGQTESVLSGVTASGASGANFGTYTNTVSGTDSNYTLTLVNGTLSIAKAALTVTGANATPSYTGLAQTNSAATITGIQGNTDSFTITGYGTGTNAGTYNDTLLATAAGATNAANYTISYTNGSLVIGKATLTVTADNKTKVYGDANPALTATITGYVNGESASVITGAPAISTTATQYSNVASYTITPVVGTLAASNYNFTYANGALSVTAAPLTITGASANPTYSGLAQTNSAATITGIKGSTDSFTITGYGTGTNAGTHLDTLVATAVGATQATNYDITITNGALTIDKANATVTGNSANPTYTGLAQSVAGFTATGLVNGQTESVLSGVTASGASATNAGTYTNTVSGTDSNYTLTLVNGALTIAKANATVTGNSANVTYNGSDQSVSGFTATGLVNGQTESVLSGVTASGASGANFGTYTNTVSGTDSNYTLTLVNGTLAIAKAALTVTGTNATPSYTGLAQTNSAATITGIQGNTDSFTITGYGTGTNAGTYNDTLLATAAGATNAANYTISYTNGSLVIGKADITYTSTGDTNVTYNGSAQTASNAYTVSGVFARDAGKVAVTVTAGTGTNVGTYADSAAVLGLTGSAVGNYQLASTGNNYGSLVIAQLSSVTYIGATDGNWSVASNWTNGALPTANNVATVFIPSDVTVNYDSAVVGQVQSTINSQGNIQFADTSAFTFISPVLGSGSITQAGTGALTISGNNAGLTGNVLLSNGSSVVLGHRNALGSGKIISDNGTLSTTAGLRLASLTVDGPVRIASDITSLGAQNYTGPVLLSAGDPTLTTTNANITFGSTLNAVGANRSLTINAGSGQVTFNGKVGDIGYTYGEFLSAGKAPNIAVLDVAAGKIVINADVETVDAQIYRGPVVIGDNGSNGTIRRLISVDPNIAFMSTVDDSLANTHTLSAAAVSFNSAVPAISFGGAVGSSAPLYALNAVVGLQDVSLLSKVGTANVEPANYFGDITISGDVSTLENQTYTASKIALGGSQGAGILGFTSAEGKIIFNTRTSAPGGFVIQDGALLKEVNFNVLSDNSVVGFNGIAGVAGQFNTPASDTLLAEIISGNTAGTLSATLMANNNFQMVTPSFEGASVSVSSPQDVQLCATVQGSEQDSQSCAQ